MNSRELLDKLVRGLYDGWIGIPIDEKASTEEDVDWMERQIVAAGFKLIKAEEEEKKDNG